MSSILHSEAAKPNYLRTPCWRWRLALQCLVEGTVPEEIIRRSRAAKDRWLLAACRFYQDRQELVHYSGRLQTKFPVMHEAFMLFHDCRQEGGYKWAVEAMLMTKATDKEIADTFHPLYGEKTIEMFRKVFFDIDSYKEDPVAMFCTVLATSLGTTHSTTDCDFTWKAFAYTRGFEAVKKLIKFRGGADIDQDYVRFMREMSTKRRYYNEYHYSASIRASFSQPAVALFEQADRLWNMETARKKLTGQNEEGLGEQSALALLSAIEEAFLDPNLQRRISERSGISDPTNDVEFEPDTALEEKMLQQSTEN